ncbi:MAG TPA: TetR/AcrR family transcriptional regulator C-terminal domain-containing protein [Terracidiphilus sp.]|nr:TetR/AcrR family transcriptional regulator C-terminal domain-containing protein [Terracidiphilus sp.]
MNRAKQRKSTPQGPPKRTASRRRPALQTASRASSRNRRAGSATPLQREQIVAAALRIVDRHGLKALSMRRLGAELGVDPMAVYYHLPNKQALLDAIVEAVMSSIDLTVDNPAKPPEERVLAAARAYRDVLLAHVNALPILLAHGPVTPGAMRPVELLIGILRDAGLPPAEALMGMNVIAGSVRGAVGMGPAHEPSQEEFAAMWQALPAAEFPLLAEGLSSSRRSFEEIFDFGIRAITRGLLGEAASKPRAHIVPSLSKDDTGSREAEDESKILC